MCYKCTVVHTQMSCAVLVNEVLSSVLVRFHRGSFAKLWHSA